MFSYVRVHPKTHGHVRGSPLLHSISQQQHKHAHLRIARVLSFPGHNVIFIDGGKVAIMLDNVPKAITSSKRNEEISLKLLSQLLLLNDHQIRFENNLTGSVSHQLQTEQPSNTTVQSKSTLSIEGIKNMTNIEGIRNMTSTTNEFMKKNFNKILGTITPTAHARNSSTTVKGNGFDEVIQQPPPQPQQEDKPFPLFLFNDLEELRGENQIFAICDFSSPISCIFFDEEGDYDRLYALQTNGLLWRWRFKDWTWIKEGSGRSVLPNHQSRVQNAAFIPHTKNLIFSQIDDQGRISLWCRQISTSDWDWDVGIPVQLDNLDEISNVFEIRPGKEGGAWIFTQDNVYYAYEPHVEHSAVTPLGGKFIQAMLKNITEMKSKEDQKLTHSHDSLYYCAKCVHPLSGELILLDLQGQIHIWIPQGRHIQQRTLNSSSIFLSISLNSYYDVLSRHSKFIAQVDKYSQSPNNTALQTLKKEAQRCRLLKIFEMFMVHDSILCITNQDSCLYIEPRTCVSLGQTQLPNEIVLDSQDPDDMNGVEIYDSLKLRTVLWDLHHDALQMGVFCGSAIYELKSPPLSELLKAEHVKSADTFAAERTEGGIQDSERYHIAMIAKQWNLEGWHVKYLLDLIMEEKENKTRVKDDKKRQILQELCRQLENPTLVWTGAKSITEQEMLIEQLAQFCQHFPAPDSSFWLTEKQKQIDQISWEETLSSVNSEDESRLERLTVLNLSVAPTLAKSLSISKRQIEDLSRVQPSVMVRQSESIDQLSDVELYDLMDQDPHATLNHLCSKCGLEPLLGEEPREGELIDGQRVPEFQRLDPSFMTLFDGDNSEDSIEDQV
jgi:hypothetical protein